MSDQKLRQSTILDLVSTNLDLVSTNIEYIYTMSTPHQPDMPEACKSIHPQAMVFLAIAVQESQFLILKQNGCPSAILDPNSTNIELGRDILKQTAPEI
jgi:hypothetical protein